MPAPAEPPSLGVGLGHRPQLHDLTVAHRDEVDWLEIITDRYLHAPAALEQLRGLRDEFTLVPHGLEMSVGSDEPLDEEYLNAVRTVADAVDAPWVSDHLCFTRDGGVDLGSLTPVHRTKERARQIAGKAQQVQDTLGRPFLLENIAYYLDLPGDCGEAEFFCEVLEHCSCGILLDLNNAAVNARNHGFAVEDFLDALPLSRVRQVHIAGCVPVGDAEKLQIDSHDDRVSDEVFDLLALLLRKGAPVRGILLERDDGFPEDFQEIVHDLRRAREIQRVHGQPT